ncbi:MAG: hypothetical protein GTN53_44505 [Candidatus Aminicenantes bacterium]|nr:hypothetical protein [Candidatus Aminicenantes bacterium]NIQ73500.1 hypothetical protein [Candidatus Aminicenantes bacterium]NIT29569.1 hypothetical protein [Candidatus Aminicenantes bacterium]
MDVRVIAATNKEFSGEIHEGRFREDLYYRLSVINIVVPPLRDRGEDVVLLATSFLSRFSSEYKKSLIGFNEDAIDAVKRYRWPGNVREMENKVRRAVILSGGSQVTPKDLELNIVDDRDFDKTLMEFREKSERDYIMNILIRRNWNVSRAAIDLGVSRPTLHGLIKKYNISDER